MPFICFWLPLWIAEPKPSIAISMRIPQNTPNAVRNVRSRFDAQRRPDLFPVIEVEHLLIPQRVDRVDLRGRARREVAGERAGEHEEQRRADADRRCRSTGCTMKSFVASCRAARAAPTPADSPRSPATPVRNTASWMIIEDDRARRRAERLAHADLLRALLDRDHHDVRHADDAGGERAEPDHDDERSRSSRTASGTARTARRCCARGRPACRRVELVALGELADDLVDDRLRLLGAGVADGELEHAELLAAVERELRGRHRDVDLALLLFAARIGEHADDLERRRSPTMIHSPIGSLVGVEQELATGWPITADLRRCAMSALVEEPALRHLVACR